MRGLSRAAVVAALALAGCAGDSPRLAESDLSKAVLQPADLPAPFVQFDEGPLGVTETTGALRSDPVRFGRVGGWKARYRRPGSPATAGPLVVESRADLFEDAEGATKDLVAHRGELTRLRQATGGRSVGVELGEEAAGVTFREGRVRFFRVAWRHENATALVFVNGFDGKLELGEVLALARKQQRRLESQAG